MIVTVSDLHPDTSTAGLPRFDDVQKALDEAVRFACEQNARSFIFAGDLVTNDPSNDLLIRCLMMVKRAKAKLASYQIPSHWMRGNHDVFEDGLDTSVVDLFEPDAIKHPCIRHCRARDDDGEHTIAIAFLPFTPSSHRYDPIEACHELKKQAAAEDLEVRLVVGHLNIEGITVGSETTDFPRGRDVFFPTETAKVCFPKAVLANGHYHQRQVFDGIHIIGSLVGGLTKGEVGNDSGFLVFDV